MFSNIILCLLVFVVVEISLPVSWAATFRKCDRDALIIEKMSSLRAYPYIFLGKVISKKEVLYEGDVFDAGKVNGKRLIFDVEIDVVESLKGEIKHFTISAAKAAGTAVCNHQPLAAAYKVGDKKLFFFRLDPTTGPVSRICCLPLRSIKNSKTLDGLRPKIADLLRNDQIAK